MSIKTSELEGAALDWAAASIDPASEDVTGYSPSTGWGQGGPLIEQYLIKLTPINREQPVVWHALTDDGERLFGATGPTPLIAAMRAIVAAELGDTVDVPEELLP